MLRKIKWMFVLLLLLLSACASPTPEPMEPAATSLPPLEDAWTVKMTQSGGIMGMLRSIELHADGTFMVWDERAGQTVEGQLSEDELSRFTELVSLLQYQPVDSLAVCADCFVYSLEITGGDRGFATEVDDITLPGSGLEFLVSKLQQIMDRELNS